MIPTLLEHYNSIKYFTYLDKSYSINREFLKNEFSWLYDHMDKISHFVKYDIIIKDDIYQSLILEKYANLLIYMKQLPRINLLIIKYKNRVDYNEESDEECDKECDKENTSIIETFMKDMETSFNSYFYNSIDIIPPTNELYEWTEYYRVILFTLHLITTHLDEIEFDLFAPKM